MVGEIVSNRSLWDFDFLILLKIYVIYITRSTALENKITFWLSICWDRK